MTESRVADADGTLWHHLDRLLMDGSVSIDRPRGTPHPRFPSWVYPLDYGFVVGTVAGDGDGIDVWVGGGEPRVTAVVATFDPLKRDAELKIAWRCTEEELRAVEVFYVDQPQAALLIRRDG